MEREVGGGIRMGNTCKPMADSFQCMTKSTTIKKNKKKSINSSVLNFHYHPTLTAIYDYWKNHNFDYMDFCWQSNISATG